MRTRPLTWTVTTLAAAAACHAVAQPLDGGSSLVVSPVDVAATSLPDDTSPPPADGPSLQTGCIDPAREPLGLSICDIPARTCSRYHVGMTLVDVEHVTQGLLGFDTLQGPAGPTVRTFGSLELVHLELFFQLRVRGGPPSLARALESAERLVAMAERIDTAAAIGRNEPTLEERTAQLLLIDCELSAMLDELEVLYRELDTLDAALRRPPYDYDIYAFGLSKIRENTPIAEQQLHYLRALVDMQTAACFPEP